MNMKARLAKHIRGMLPPTGTGVEIDDATSLIDKGIVDSIGLMELVTFIEQETGLRVPDEEISPDNFESIATIDAMIHRLRAPGARVDT